MTGTGAKEGSLMDTRRSMKSFVRSALSLCQVVGHPRICFFFPMHRAMFDAIEHSLPSILHTTNSSLRIADSA